MRETLAEPVVSIRKYLKPIRSLSKAAMPRRITPEGVDGVDIVCTGGYFEEEPGKEEGEDGGSLLCLQCRIRSLRKRRGLDGIVR